MTDGLMLCPFDFCSECGEDCEQLEMTDGRLLCPFCVDDDQAKVQD